MKTARKFIVSGVVQGVGFRFFAQRAAAKHQVTGYVRNLPDGRVEALAEGNETAVENFKAELIAGSTHSVVEQIEEIVIELNRNYPIFRIER
ncbi:MAG: acylphosphatase [Pyrinomonadaceae bacterium]